MSDPLHPLNETQIEDIKADIRFRLFSAVRSAFKALSSQHGVQAKQLAEAMGKDTGYVSRVLSGTSAGITAETAAVFLEAMGWELRPTAVPKDLLSKSNRDVRPRALPVSYSPVADQVTGSLGISALAHGHPFAGAETPVTSTNLVFVLGAGDPPVPTSRRARPMIEVFEVTK